MTLVREVQEALKDQVTLPGGPEGPGGPGGAIGSVSTTGDLSREVTLVTRLAVLVVQEILEPPVGLALLHLEALQEFLIHLHLVVQLVLLLTLTEVQAVVLVLTHLVAVQQVLVLILLEVQ